MPSWFQKSLSLKKVSVSPHLRLLRKRNWLGYAIGDQLIEALISSMVAEIPVWRFPVSVGKGRYWPWIQVALFTSLELSLIDLRMLAISSVVHLIPGPSPEFILALGTEFRAGPLGDFFHGADLLAKGSDIPNND